MPPADLTLSTPVFQPTERRHPWRHLWRVVAAEALKQHRTLFGTRLVYFSLLVWPALQLATAYYAFQPFVGAPGLAQRWSLAADPRAIFLFFTTGSLGYVFFWSLTQSAWQFSWERFNGTLELLFLTPASRLALVLANGAAALFQSVWLFLCFSVALAALVGGLHIAAPAMLAVAFVGLLVPAVAWAALLNSIFLFARDSGFLYTILEEPMAFFGGVRIPLLALPFWARLVGLIFPLTTSLVVLRGVLLEGATLATIWPQLAFLAAFSVALIAAAALVLRRGEARARRTGSLSLF